MQFFVHSRNRAALRGGTLSALAAASIRCTIVCPPGEYATYTSNWPSMKVVGCGEVGLPKTQQFIIDGWRKTADKIVLLDDDLVFFTREGNTKKRHRSTPEDIVAMFRAMSLQLNHTVHAGIMVNKDIGLQDVAPTVASYGPMRSVLAYRTNALNGVRFDRVVSKSDYDVTLQLLRRGCPAGILRMWGHEQCGGPDLPGGATDYRNEDMHRKASEGLKRLHPEFVTIVTKERKGWSFPRMDVRVAWKKALDSAEDFSI